MNEHPSPAYEPACVEQLAQLPASVPLKELHALLAHAFRREITATSDPQPLPGSGYHVRRAAPLVDAAAPSTFHILRTKELTSPHGAATVVVDARRRADGRWEILALRSVAPDVRFCLRGDSVRDLDDLDARTRRVLASLGIATVGQLTAWTWLTSLSAASLEEIRACLGRRGFIAQLGSRRLAARLTASMAAVGGVTWPLLWLLGGTEAAGLGVGLLALGVLLVALQFARRATSPSFWGNIGFGGVAGVAPFVYDDVAAVALAPLAAIPLMTWAMTRPPRIRPSTERRAA